MILSVNTNLTAIAISLRELKCKNYEKFTCNLFKVQVKVNTHHQDEGQAAQLHQEGDGDAHE